LERAFEGYFAALGPDRQRVAQSLRDAITRAGPELKRKLSYGYPAWHGQAWICSVIAHRTHCNLQLARGAELVDRFPERIEGTGKALRHVKVHSEDDIDAELEDIIDAAIALDRNSPPARRGKG
jgi:hypothetical protein